MRKVDLKDLTLQGLAEFTGSLRLPRFRADQIFSWLYRPGIRAFSQMTDLNKGLRQQLGEQAFFSTYEPAVYEKSTDGTIKFGFRLEDDTIVEAVLIPDRRRHTLCVSSQVGCAMGCSFCLTGTMGIIRNLRPAEMVGQVSAVRDFLLDEEGEEARINNLVFMGMGEPLANFDNLLAAIDILTEQRGLDFAGRRITVSTCGLVPRIRELGEKTEVNLAVSLHAVDDETRSRLMPINNKFPIAELLEACRDFPMPSRRRIMFEYILIRGINDSDEDAHRLARLLKDIRCKINLLPYNATGNSEYQTPTAERVEAFQRILWQADYTVLIRESRGADISAACGQLATKEMQSSPGVTSGKSGLVQQPT